MINSIYHICRKSILKIRGRHIPSHQAESCIYENIEWWGQQNDDMDWLAKFLIFEKRRLKNKNSKFLDSASEGFAIIINEVKISGNYINNIHDMIHGNAIMQYWIRQG